MPSSSTVTLRALVMLVCLIMVPLVAVSGTSLPKMVTDAIRGRKLPRSSRATEGVREAAQSGGEAPAFVPAVQLPDREIAHSGNPVIPVVAAEQPRALPPAPAEVPTATAPLWGPGEPPTSATPRKGQAASHDPQANRVRWSSTGTGRLETQEAIDRSNSRSGATVGGTGPEENGDRFGDIQRRLRELGASHYVLETWGERGDQFRFRCKMDATGVPDGTRQFEATHRDAIAAMQKVLEQVEAWRGKRLP